MTLKELVITALKEKGYSGLCDPDAPCGCGLDDIAPCGSACNIIYNCQPAYEIKCIGKECQHPCDAYDESGNGKCYSINKPEGEVSK